MDPLEVNWSEIGRQHIRLTRVILLQVDRLEQDASEVLRLVRAVKNTLAPINRIPPELLSLIPRYWSYPTDEDLVALTHVCWRWRETLTRCPSLWTRLDCRHAQKTRAFIERSMALPLEIKHPHYEDPYDFDALSLVGLHAGRVVSIEIAGEEEDLFRSFVEHFSCPIPLLRNLDLSFQLDNPPELNDTLFDGNLSSLCTLSLSAFFPRLPCRDLSKLTTIALNYIPGAEISLTQLLDMFANAHVLNEVELDHAIPDSSDAPPGRMVSLPHLTSFSMCTDIQSLSILLNHLSIPAGALLDLGFGFNIDEFPLQRSLPENPENLQNLLFITSVFLKFGKEEVDMQLNGPSGRLEIWGHRKPRSERKILQSLDFLTLSKTQTLAVTSYNLPTLEDCSKSPPHRILNVMKDLRTLFLNSCSAPPFILALNPHQCPTQLILCPELENLILYAEERRLFDFEQLTTMAKRRASEGAKLQSITMISGDELVTEEDVFGLRDHVGHVECRFGEGRPAWDDIPGN